ncbi:MAG: amidohydrolase family protein [Candidatus Lokiarchaeota archaeon]|nr:amidohydrolase family protein [Candidatus Lokiarchaeota archaeon]MBD3199854.1 amidohydrolase family protein [Candidatus Lokiarchaeota archaeon]
MINDIKIFDAHFHYTGKFKKENESLINFMDRYHIDKAIITTLNKSANSKLLMNTNKTFNRKTYLNNLIPKKQHDHTEVINLIKKYPERLYGFCWFSPNIATDDDWALLRKYIADYDFKGVKIQTTLDNLDISKDLDRLVDFCIEMDVPLYYHSGNNFFFQKPIKIEDLYKLYLESQDLKLIIGHSAFTMEYTISVLRYFQGFDNVYFETSMSVPYGINVLIKVMGNDKIIYGSDAPAATTPDIEIQKIKALNLKPEIEKLIFYENISNLIGI